MTPQQIEDIRSAIIELWKKEFGSTKYELDKVGVYFIVGFVLEAINEHQKK